MIKSMTAFARKDVEAEWGGLTWEIRSVNHRYLESHFKLPDGYRELETALRECQRKHLKRGKIDTALRVKMVAGQNETLEVNLPLVANINQIANQINRILDNPAHISALEVMNWPGVLGSSEPDSAAISGTLLESYESAIKQLLEIRENEGRRLEPLFHERLDQIDSIVSQVRGQLPDILRNQKESIEAKLSELKSDLDPARIEQEMVLLAQKSDVAEELDRLEAHVEEVRQVLVRKEPVGRRLDFLMQELNREANTLSSKSIVTDTTRAAVDLKVIIEQMREQVQNIE
ncbi:MAG: YicC family protein [Proteobacteria bacterium]|nr:MAG: YicC family protein [Pseudomonadota bacterium]